MKHDEARTGLWAASISEDGWSCEDFFDTREEAIAWARLEHEDGSFFTGRVVELTDEEVVQALIRDTEDAEFDEDHWGWEEKPMLRVSHEAEAELLALVTEWVARHKVRVPTWRVEESVESA